jgi:hypothetical protein
MRERLRATIGVEEAASVGWERHGARRRRRIL